MKRRIHATSHITVNDKPIEHTESRAAAKEQPGAGLCRLGAGNPLTAAEGSRNIRLVLVLTRSEGECVSGSSWKWMHVLLLREKTKWSECFPCCGIGAPNRASERSQRCGLEWEAAAHCEVQHRQACIDR